MKDEPDLAGRIEMGWHVDATGAASAVRDVSDTTGSDALQRCMLPKIERWLFAVRIPGDFTWLFVFRVRPTKEGVTSTEDWNGDSGRDIEACFSAAAARSASNGEGGPAGPGPAREMTA